MHSNYKEKNMLSILLSIFLLVGVSSGRNVRTSIHNDADDGGAAEPIELPEARRICASLCMSGLGGKPCGANCQAIAPLESQLQSNQSEREEKQQESGHSRFTRRDACPLLCHYQLGDPLCGCTPQLVSYDAVYLKIDFDNICGFFCVKHGYNIFGCPACDTYQANKEEIEAFSYTISKSKKKEVDWEKWCRERCAVGDGGAACNCDILPLSLPLPPSDKVPEQR